MSYRIAFVTSHPIQYQVPVFRRLAAMEGIDLTVLFCMIPNQQQQGDGFGVAFEWDIPLLEGYQYQVLKNIAANPGVTHFKGCDTPDILKVLEEGRYDAVVVNGWVVKSCFQTLYACRKLGIPCIVRGEANILRPRAWYKRLRHRSFIRKYAAYLYIGTSNAEFYRSYGVHSEQLFPAFYCIENDRFACSEQKAKAARMQFRKKWNISDNETVFLFSGKLEQKKHPLELITSFHIACNDGCKARLLIVGDGELRTECENLITKYNLPITMTGFLNQSEIADAYYASDCMVLASDYGETWGLVVNEAMACGKPAIVSDQVGCAQDLIEQGVTGAIFSFGDWSALSDLLCEYSTNNANLSRMGKVAQERIQDYSPKAAAQGIFDAVTYVVKQKN